MSEDTERELTKFEEAADEWENVVNIIPNVRDSNDDRPRPSASERVITLLVTVDQFVTHISNIDMEDQLQLVTSMPGHKKSLVRRVFSCLLSSPSLPPHLRHTKRLVQATAFLSFDNQESLHLSVLRTIYRQLTGSKVECPRYGSHWEDIGFQGNDPSTDLRGVGLLGLVQALYLVMTPEIIPFSRSIYNLSKNENQEFPLLVLSLNITRITLHILRDGLLDRYLTLEDNVWNTTNFLYCSLMYHLYSRWKGEHLTISSSGFVLQETETWGRKNVGKVIERFEKALSTEYSVADKQMAREQIAKDTMVNKGPGGSVS